MERVMVARSRPVGVRQPHPPKPEDDTERLRQLLETLQRNVTAITKAAEEIVEIAERKRAA